MNNVDIGKAFSDGWNVFKENMAVCVLSSLLAGVVASATCGLLAGPMMAGQYMLIRRLLRKTDPKPSAGDVFKGFDVGIQSFLLLFVPGLCYFVVQGILCFIPVLGWAAAVIVCAAYAPIVNWALMLVANRGMTWQAAFMQVFQDTIHGKFTVPLCLVFIAAFVGSAGIMLCCVGILFSVPLMHCIIAAGYEQVFGDDPAPAAAEPPEAEVVG